MYKFRLMTCLILRRKGKFLSMKIRNPPTFEIRYIPLLGCAIHISNYKCGIDKIPLMERIIQTRYLELVLMYPEKALQVAFAGVNDSRRAVCIEFTVWPIVKDIRSCYLRVRIFYHYYATLHCRSGYIVVFYTRSLLIHCNLYAWAICIIPIRLNIKEDQIHDTGYHPERTPYSSLKNT